MAVSTALPVPMQGRSMSWGPSIVKQSIYEISLTAKHRLGERIEIGDGRVFHYAKAGLVDLVDGKLLQGAITDAQFLNMAIYATSAIGEAKAYVTLGSTAVVQNAFAEGYLHCSNTAPAGTYYKVASHLAASGAAHVVINLYDPLYKALTIASSLVTLTKNPWDGLLVGPSAALTAPPLGVAIVDVTASYYFWAQTWGPCALLTRGTIAPGQNVGWITGEDGCVGLMSAYTTVCVGTCISLNVSTDYSLIFLRIAP